MKIQFFNYVLPPTCRFLTQTQTATPITTVRAMIAATIGTMMLTSSQMFMDSLLSSMRIGATVPMKRIRYICNTNVI